MPLCTPTGQGDDATLTIFRRSDEALFIEIGCVWLHLNAFGLSPTFQNTSLEARGVLSGE